MLRLALGGATSVWVPVRLRVFCDLHQGRVHLRI